MNSMAVVDDTGQSRWMPPMMVRDGVTTCANNRSWHLKDFVFIKSYESEILDDI